MKTLDRDLLAQVRGEEVVSGFDEWLETLTVGLRAELDQLGAAREEALRKVRDIDSEIGRIKRILRAAEPSKTTKTKRKSQQAEVPRYSVAPWRKEAALKALREHGPKMSNRQLEEALGWPRPTVNTTTLVLRQEGKIRLAGEGKDRTRFYALLPAGKVTADV